jgi:hypothetical protein
MSMQMEEAEYERLPDCRLHRYLSLGIVLLWLLIEFQWHGPWLLRPRTFLLMPLISIWFADEAADRNALNPAAWRIDSSARFIRTGGWIMLIAGMAYFTTMGILHAPKSRPAPVDPPPQEQPRESPHR